MTAIPQETKSFLYRARTSDGREVSGTINASDVSDARLSLTAMNLSVTELEPTRAATWARPRRGEDFLAFNQQLAQLAASGLPIEQGLRLIAEDLRHGAMARTMAALSRELESGKSLAQAIESHRGDFPPLYNRIVDAGIRSGNLSGLLLSIGRHYTLVNRLRAKLWSTLAYPLILLVLFLALLLAIVAYLMPMFEETYGKLHYELPAITQFVIALGHILRNQYADTIGGAIIVVSAILVIVFGRMRSSWVFADRLIMGIPLVGPIMRRSLIARWCDAVSIGVKAGLDLPAAFELAGDAVASPLLRRDGQQLAEWLSAGQTGKARPGVVLPSAILATLTTAATTNTLPQTLEMLAQTYQQQAEQKISAVPAVLLPGIFLVLALALLILVLSIVAPLISMLQAITAGATIPIHYVHH